MSIPRVALQRKVYFHCSDFVPGPAAMLNSGALNSSQELLLKIIVESHLVRNEANKIHAGSQLETGSDVPQVSPPCPDFAFLSTCENVVERLSSFDFE